MPAGDNIGRLHALSPKAIFGRGAKPSRHGGPGRHPGKPHASRLRPIEEVEIGDWVWARGPQGPVKRRVKRLFRHSDKAVLRVRYADPSGEVHDLLATSEHPFWVVGKRWVAARDLKPGDPLVSLREGPAPRVIEVVAGDRTADVFNFEVEGDHNYFVGRIGVLVHNSSVRMAPDVWGSKDGIQLPPVGGERFNRLVQGIHEQFAATKSYAILPTGMSSAHPQPGRLPVSTDSATPGIFGSFEAIGQPAKYVTHNGRAMLEPEPIAIESMEALRVWGHHLLRETFGANIAKLSHAQYHYSPPRTAPSRDPVTSSWHADGPQIVYGLTISTEGPGTDVLLAQPSAPVQWSRESPGSPAIAVPTWSLMVFTGSGVLRYRQAGHLPTIHREPLAFPVDRSLYLVRVNDGRDQ